MKNRLKQLLTLGSVYVIGGILEKGISFLFLPLITYYLAPKDYGIVGLMMLTVNLITPLFLSPVNGGVYRFYYSPDYQDKRDQIVFNGLLFIFFQAVIFGTTMFLFKEKISQLILGDKSYSYVVAMFSFILMFRPVSQYFMMLLQIQKRAKLYIIVSLSSAIIFAALVIVLLTVFKMGFMALVYSHLINTIFIVIVVFPNLFRYMKRKIDFTVLKPVLSYGYPLVIASLSVFLMQSADSFILKIFQPLQIVGLYLFASKFVAIMNLLILLPTKNALVPLALELESKPEQLRLFLSRTANYYCMISFLLWLILSMYSREIVMVMATNSDYWNSWWVIPILGFTSVIQGLNVFFNKGISLTNKTTLIALNHVVASIINIGLNFFLIPFWGAIGAAIATCFSIIYFAISNAYFSYKTYNLRFDCMSIAKIFVISIFCIILGIISNCCYIYFALIIKSVILLMYPVLIIQAKLISRAEISKLKSFVINFFIGHLHFLKKKFVATRI
jgi:O-antigen/teichoic acid export membrane protein